MIIVASTSELKQPKKARGKGGNDFPDKFWRDINEKEIEASETKKENPQAREQKYFHLKTIDFVGS